MPRLSSLSALALCFLASTLTSAEPPSCQVVGGVARLAGISEASGLAASLKTPGVLWSHNDSGEPVIFALTEAGAVRGRIGVKGAAVTDWEGIAVGECPQGSCLYIADIGDNNLTRRTVTIYRTPEPGPTDAQTANAEAMHATYPDGPRDAEAMIVLPRGEMLIVTKGNGGPVDVFRFPSPFRNGATAVLERVATLATASGKKETSARGNRITDAGVSRDGRFIVLRTHTALTFYEAREFASSKIREVFRFDVAPLAEPQGEGVALGAKTDVWLAGEGGGKGKPGTLARLSCILP